MSLEGVQVEDYKSFTKNYDKIKKIITEPHTEMIYIGVHFEYGNDVETLSLELLKI